jgi:hypothetical protein
LCAWHPPGAPAMHTMSEVNIRITSALKVAAAKFLA